MLINIITTSISKYLYFPFVTNYVMVITVVSIAFDLHDHFISKAFFFFLSDSFHVQARQLWTLSPLPASGLPELGPVDRECCCPDLLSLEDGRQEHRQNCGHQQRHVRTCAVLKAVLVFAVAFITWQYIFPTPPVALRYIAQADCQVCGTWYNFPATRAQTLCPYLSTSTK